MCAPLAHAGQIPDHVAVRVIIGEAANQGYQGMVCVGEVLRRRGSSKGFTGYKAKHIDRQPKWVWEMAAKAWKDSAYTNYTRGADHFAAIKSDFTRPWWVKNCIQTYQHKSHVFYKEL